MKISELRLLEIILEEVNEYGNYSAAAGASIRAAQLAGNRDAKFLKPITNDKTAPIDDNVLAAILSISSDAELNEQSVDSDTKKRIVTLIKGLGGGADAIKKVATRLGLPLAFVTSLVGGGVAGLALSGGDNDTSSGDNIESVEQTLVPSSVYGSGWDEYEGEFAGLSNAEKMKKTWSQYENANEKRAPVSSQFAIFKYSHVPSQDITDDSLLPLSGMTAGDYYQYWNQRVQKNPEVEIPLLKKMVFGNVGKWDANFQKADDGSNLLPPDWTVMHSLYGDIIEDRALDLLQSAKNATPEERAQIYDALPNVQSDEDFNTFINDLLYSVGRQTR